MRTLALAIVVLLASDTAFAHAGEVHRDDWPWTFDPLIVVPLLISATMYLAGITAIHLRRRGFHGHRLRQMLFYGAGWLTLASALVSPLHWLGEHVFTFHMIEHEIVMAVSAPLLVLSRPLGILLWAWPKPLRHGLAMIWRRGAYALCGLGLTRPAGATMIHGAAIWIWHAPQLFDAAVMHEWVHRLQHLSFFFTALLFWWAMLRRAGFGAATWHLFITMIHTSVLGALIALAPAVLYRAQTSHAMAFGLTPLEDQQLAGLVMWVPAGTVYAGAALVFAALWITRSGQARGGHGVVRPT